MASDCLIRHAVLAALVMICGCYHPYPHNGWQGQPGYYAPPPGQMQSPGQLYIPPSNDPLTAPGSPTSTYDDSEDPDDFGRGDGSFFNEDDNVPTPRDSGGGFNGDF